MSTSTNPELVSNVRTSRHAPTCVFICGLDDEFIPKNKHERRATKAFYFRSVSVDFGELLLILEAAFFKSFITFNFQHDLAMNTKFF